MKEKQKKPITKGVAKVPMVMQLEALECGAACLCMILAYYNKWIPLEQVREDCGVSRDGSNAKNMLKAARYYGLTAKGYSYEPESLKKNGKFPCIVHWNFNHFVVLNGFGKGKAYLNDPAKGNYSVSMEKFDEAFTGICLFFEPTEAFVPSGKPNSSGRTMAMPRSSSASRSRLSPGSMPNISLACFGIKICPFSPTRTVHIYLPFGIIIDTTLTSEKQ